MAFVTTREKAERLLKEMPEERVPVALEALEAVIWGEDADTSVKAILARHGERRLDPTEFERHLGDLPRDGEG